MDKDFQRLPTPPSSHKSPRSERPQLNSSEETTSSTGSAVIDTTSKYRIGIPAPLRALPLQTAHPKTDFPLLRHFNRISIAIQRILCRADLEQWHVNFVQRYVDGEIPTNDDWTVLIKTHHRDNWVGVLHSIHDLLAKSDLSKFKIEMYDECAKSHYFPVDLESHMLAKWPILELGILRVLGRGPEWRSMTLLNRGNEEKGSSPTVTIGLSAEADADWRSRRYAEIMDYLRGRAPFEVAFVRSKLRTSPGRIEPACQGPSAFAGPVPLGSGIGYCYSNRSEARDPETKEVVTRGDVDDNSGTLGGFVRVQYQGQTHMMGLTSHHVIANSNLTQSENANGLKPLLDREHPTIFSPSMPDTEASQLSCAGDLAQKEKQLVGGDGILGQRDKVALKSESASETDRRRLNVMEESYRNLEAWAKAMKEHDGTFAKVFASSGVARCYGDPRIAVDEHGTPYSFGNTIDWALLRVTDPVRLGANQIFKKDVGEVLSHMCRVWQPIRDARLELPMAGESVFKLARSGFTMGRVNQVKTIINSYDEHKFYSARVVVGIDLGVKRAPFMWSGDSGTLILDSVGSIIGLGLGADDESNTGYMMAISHVYEDIEKRTGAHVVEPILC